MIRLQLALPWIQEHQQLGDLAVSRGPTSTLAYDDGITLLVKLLDPADYRSVEDALRAARDAEGAGVVTLVAGAIPVPWRAALRSSGVSFIDTSGVAEIRWPRIEVSAGQFAQTVERRRAPLPLQKGHAIVIQELVIAALRNENPTIGDAATRAGVGISTASRAIAQLAGHGLVDKRRVGRQVVVHVSDPAAVANLLVPRIAWPPGTTLSGYLWGATVWDTAAALSQRARRAGVALAITGRSALPFLGILSTFPPAQIRCWVAAPADGLDAIARQLTLEPAPPDESNVVLGADPWKAGVHSRSERRFDRWEASVAHPLRVWCDLHDEPRGTDFADQLWKELVSDG